MAEFLDVSRSEWIARVDDDGSRGVQNGAWRSTHIHEKPVQSMGADEHQGVSRRFIRDERAFDFPTS